MPSARWFSPILVLLAVVAGEAPAQVASGNSYTIGGVDVDVTGADAIQARQQGIREAQRKAVKLLVERMVAPEDRARVPPVDNARLDGMVRGVEFSSERTAANRYIGTLNVVFSAEPVNAWLREAGISVAETVARPALVIPLWKDKNGCRAARRPQCLARRLARPRYHGQRRAGDAGARRPARPERPVGRGSLCRRRLGAVAAERALSRADDHRGDRSKATRARARSRSAACATTPRPARAASCPGSRWPTPTSSADAAKKIHAKLDEDWRDIAMVRRDSQAGLDVVVPIRALATGCRCASGWARSRRSRVSRALARIRSRRSASRIFRHRRAAAAHAGPGRPAARQGCRSVATAGAVTRHDGTRQAGRSIAGASGSASPSSSCWCCGC